MSKATPAKKYNKSLSITYYLLTIISIISMLVHWAYNSLVISYATVYYGSGSSREEYSIANREAVSSTLTPSSILGTVAQWKSI